MSAEDYAALVEQMIDEAPWKDQMWARCALTIAARAIRRGRHLTESEKLENLARSFEEHPGETDEERAASARAAAWLRGETKSGVEAEIVAESAALHEAETK